VFQAAQASGPSRRRPMCALGVDDQDFVSFASITAAPLRGTRVTAVGGNQPEAPLPGQGAVVLGRLSPGREPKRVSVFRPGGACGAGGLDGERPAVRRSAGSTAVAGAAHTWSLVKGRPITTSISTSVNLASTSVDDRFHSGGWLLTLRTDNLSLAAAGCWGGSVSRLGKKVSSRREAGSGGNAPFGVVVTGSFRRSVPQCPFWSRSSTS